MAIAAGLCGLGASSAGHAGVPAEFFNEFDWAPSAPSPGPTNFEIVFAGDVSCLIPPQNQKDGSTDPFPNANPIGISYNPATGNTTVTFSGGTLTPGQRYHFGLNQGFTPTPPLQVVSKTWTFDSVPPSPLPIINVAPTTAQLTPPFKYAVVYLEAAFQQGGQTYGSWYEMPYSAGGKKAVKQVPLTFSNYGSQTLYVTNSGIQTGLSVPTSPSCATNPNCKANQTLLNNLDFAKFPPPGQKGSKFVALQSPPPPVLQPTTPVAVPVCVK